MKKLLFAVFVFLALTGFVNQDVNILSNKFVSVGYEFINPPQIKTWSPSSRTINADEGQSAKMEITFSSGNDPDARIEVFKDGKPLGVSSNYQMTTNGDRFQLTILDIKSGDSGTYTIRVSNKAGTVSINFTLTVNSNS
ncbi:MULTISPECIES: immunoglobulin domain-containing protein [Butyricimonas]|uniref:immunoglobulin domain-containing protein n=1 Tax=Butyricimonas TaxID=574697 RepID=UPI0007FB4D2E|nr:MULTISPECIES: immunoglobulin domain-containing protein [Butyricimonas]